MFMEQLEDCYRIFLFGLFSLLVVVLLFSSGIGISPFFPHPRLLVE